MAQINKKPEESWRAHQPKCCDNNKDVDNHPNINNVKYDNTLFQQFRQELF